MLHLRIPEEEQIQRWEGVVPGDTGMGCRLHVSQASDQLPLLLVLWDFTYSHSGSSESSLRPEGWGVPHPVVWTLRAPHPSCASSPPRGLWEMEGREMARPRLQGGRKLDLVGLPHCGLLSLPSSLSPHLLALGTEAGPPQDPSPILIGACSG